MTRIFAVVFFILAKVNLGTFDMNESLYTLNLTWSNRRSNLIFSSLVGEGMPWIDESFPPDDSSLGPELEGKHEVLARI